MSKILKFMRLVKECVTDIQTNTRCGCGAIGDTDSYTSVAFQQFKSENARMSADTTSYIQIHNPVDKKTNICTNAKSARHFCIYLSSLCQKYTDTSPSPAPRDSPTIGALACLPLLLPIFFFQKSRGRCSSFGT